MILHRFRPRHSDESTISTQTRGPIRVGHQIQATPPPRRKRGAMPYTKIKEAEHGR